MKQTQRLIYLLTSSAILCFSFQVLPIARAQTQAAPGSTCSIAGRITTKQVPATDVVVQLLLLDANSSRRTPATTVTTDKTGRYRFFDLKPGQYDVLPIAPTLAIPTEGRYGQPGKSVTVRPGEATTGIDFDLLPVGRITGRVTDMDGQPVSGLTVTLSLTGEGGYVRHFVPQDNRQTVTNESGEYHAFRVPPGRYLVSVGEPFTIEPPGIPAGRLPTIYTQTFHPAAAEASLAVPVDVPAGGEASGVDITVGPPLRTYKMEGRIIDSATGEPVPGVGMKIVIEDDRGRVRSEIGADWRSDAAGVFSISGARPGHYRVCPADDSASNTYGEPINVEVKDHDATGLMIKMVRGSSISGVVVVEGLGRQAGGGRLTGLGLRADVVPSTGVPTDLTIDHSASKINGDGSFRIAGLRPGRATLHLARLTPVSPQEFSLLSVEAANGATITDNLEIGQGEDVTGLRVILGRGNGVIRGQVKIEGGTLDGVSLYVSYRRTSDPPNSYYNATLDARGHFVIEKLVAGEYELMVGPMSLFVTGEAGSKTMSRLPTVKQQVTLTSGGVAEVTLVVALKP